MRLVTRFGILIASAVILIAGSARATHPVQYRQYIFAPPHSELLVTGGFAGISELYKIKGTFDLIIDPHPHGDPFEPPPTNLSQANFVNVDAELIGPIGPSLEPPLGIFSGADLDEVLNLSGLTGTLGDHDRIHFTGVDGQGRGFDVDALLFDPIAIVLDGQSQPACCDFFDFDLTALAFNRYFVDNLMIGDANVDGAVTADDLIMVQQHYGETEAGLGPPSGLLMGDGDNDGAVTAGDLIAAQQNYGAVVPAPPSAGGIPEPGTAVILLAAAGMLARRR